MGFLEFIKYIESIGFKEFMFVTYEYKNFKIDAWGFNYEFHHNNLYIGRFKFNDLTPIEKYFKKELRSIKLKRILQ